MTADTARELLRRADDCLDGFLTHSGRMNELHRDIKAHLTKPPSHPAPDARLAEAEQLLRWLYDLMVEMTETVWDDDSDITARKFWPYEERLSAFLSASTVESIQDKANKDFQQALSKVESEFASTAEPSPTKLDIGVVAITTNGTTRIIPSDEPVFLIRGQDKAGAATVRFWANRAESTGADPNIVQTARDHAAKMDSWPKKKTPDLPTSEADAGAGGDRDGEQARDDAIRALVAERDALRAQIAELQRECDEQCRLNGVGAEREAKLITERDAAVARAEKAEGESARLRTRCLEANKEANAAKAGPHWSRFELLEHELAKAKARRFVVKMPPIDTIDNGRILVLRGQVEQAIIAAGGEVV